MDQQLLALLVLIAEHSPVSTAKACKQLDLPLSQLNRLLTLLGDDSALGGLGLVAVRNDGRRQLIELSTRGREWYRNVSQEEHGG